MCSDSLGVRMHLQLHDKLHWQCSSYVTATTTAKVISATMLPASCFLGKKIIFSLIVYFQQLIEEGSQRGDDFIWRETITGAVCVESVMRTKRHGSSN